jgi:predicted GNAT family N-acyltransferase
MSLFRRIKGTVSFLSDRKQTVPRQSPWYPDYPISLSAMNDIHTSIVSWSDKRVELTSVRRAVFVEEQNVPENIELDGRDADCCHVLACDGNGKAIGTARMDSDGKIGRMAVLREFRGLGVGRKMLQTMMDYGRLRERTDFHLSAQISALDFYKKMGFEPYGEPFEEAGITHVQMRIKKR